MEERIKPFIRYVFCALLKLVAGLDLVDVVVCYSNSMLGDAGLGAEIMFQCFCGL